MGDTIPLAEILNYTNRKGSWAEACVCPILLADGDVMDPPASGSYRPDGLCLDAVRKQLFVVSNPCSLLHYSQM